MDFFERGEDDIADRPSRILSASLKLALDSISISGRLTIILIDDDDHERGLAPQRAGHASDIRILVGALAADKAIAHLDGLLCEVEISARVGVAIGYV